MMKLSQKILYCRKKAGLSQEALAEQLGVSRQAVSKWETAEAVPELSKLLLLAQAFGVTTDWLLSEDELEPERKTEPAPPPPESKAETTVGVIERLARRFSWLIGVYLAAVGAAFTGFGAFVRHAARQMSVFSNTVFGDVPAYHFADGEIVMDAMPASPLITMGTAVMCFGVVLLIAGIALAVVLRRRSKK